jgi:glycosyltransferase involved in cell wall biosynthesis
LRIFFVADGRSPTALNWMEYFLAGGHEVHLASTFACQPDKRLASFSLAPVAFSQVKGGIKFRQGVTAGNQKAGGQGVWGASMVRARTFLRQWLGPLTLPTAAKHLREVIAGVQPELVHAMRIPYEGMLAALADPAAPLLISVWGNDFTLHAPSTPLMRHYTRLALRRADALHADCQRDARLARAWGLAAEKTAFVLPGAGGIQLDVFYPLAEQVPSTPLVVNPRGFRAYIRNETFFRAIPLVLARRPETRFACPAMAGEAQAERWLSELGIAAYVDLLPQQTRPQMAELFRRALVVVSPSTHDGTPNTLLEAMACGCFPVAGDLESLREWIIPGENGLLVDPGDSQALAEAILLALENADLRRRARQHNLQLVAERAAYGPVMAQALDIYRRLGGG